MSARPQRAAPPRVATVIPRYAPIFGGAENQCRQLNGELRRQELASIAFVLTKRIVGTLAPREVVDGVEVHRIGRPGLSRWSEYGFYLRAMFFLWRRRREYDLIHCHATSLLGFAMTVVARVARRPVVLKLSSNGELVTGLRNYDGALTLDRSLTARLRRPLARFSARHADIVALNEEGLDELRLAGARHPHLLGNGVDTGHFRPLDPALRAARRAELGFADEDFVFLYAGRFVETKGIDVLLAAVAQLHEDGALPRARFCFVGSGELQGSAVVVAERGRTIAVWPPTDDVRSYLQAADAFVFPSRREGMPNAVLEAMAVGLPCVLSDIRPHRELAAGNPDLATYLFPSGQAAGLRDALIRCAAGPRAATSPDAGCIDSRYRLEHVAGRYALVYGEALAR